MVATNFKHDLRDHTYVDGKTQEEKQKNQKFKEKVFHTTIMATKN